MQAKRVILMAGLLLSLAAGYPGLATAQSIDSKVEMLGNIKVVKVSQLMAAKRDGLLTIQAEITNTTDRSQGLRYRMKWLDASGFTVWDEEPWKPLVVHGQQKTLVKVVAPTREASDFRIELHADDNWGGSGSAQPSTSNSFN